MCAENLFTAEAQRNAEIRREEIRIKTQPNPVIFVVLSNGSAFLRMTCSDFTSSSTLGLQFFSSLTSPCEAIQESIGRLRFFGCGRIECETRNIAAQFE